MQYKYTFDGVALFICCPNCRSLHFFYRWRLVLSTPIFIPLANARTLYLRRARSSHHSPVLFNNSAMTVFVFTVCIKLSTMYKICHSNGISVRVVGLIWSSAHYSVSLSIVSFARRCRLLDLDSLQLSNAKCKRHALKMLIKFLFISLSLSCLHVQLDAWCVFLWHFKLKMTPISCNKIEECYVCRSRTNPKTAAPWNSPD